MLIIALWKTCIERYRKKKEAKCYGGLIDMKKKTKNKLAKWEISEFKKEDFDNISKEDLQKLI
ncbi:hypothetical protein K8O21_004657 [Salmonella enterica subsp. enterica serovar Typhi]|nr:hypothetical protein [Salmonella enterica subsp. enterica serovar Typhi]